jgi:aspartate beta-hydroxylase
LKITNLIYDLAAVLLRNIYDWRIFTPPVLDVANYFPLSKSFSSDWQKLRDEALCIAENLPAVPRFHDLMSQQADISAQDERDWRMFVVKAYGVTISKNAARCPVLLELISSNPDVLTATISFLAPWKHIPKHRGPFRGVVRYYLGLSVPNDSDGQTGTVLTIDGTEYRLANGQSILWDDTYAHEVRNNTGEVRIALLLDVRRKGMPLDMKILSNFLIAAAGVAVRLRKFE